MIYISYEYVREGKTNPSTFGLQGLDSEMGVEVKDSKLHIFQRIIGNSLCQNRRQKIELTVAIGHLMKEVCFSHPP